MDPRIPVRCFSLLLLAAALLSAQALKTLGEAYRQSPGPRTHAALLHFAAAHPKDIDGALALLSLGSAELDQRDDANAIAHLTAATARLPKLRDYTAYLLAAAQFDAKSPSAVENNLGLVWKQEPQSPLRAKAAVLLANAYLALNRPRDAVALMTQHPEVPEVESAILLAHAYEADKQSDKAATEYQLVYTAYPLSKEADDAQQALARFPAPNSPALLARSLKLLDGGHPTQARTELEEVVPKLSGAPADRARVSIGVAMYDVRNNGGAYSYLDALQVSDPDAAAERLFYVLQSARRLNNEAAMKTALDALAGAYPQSPWRLKALNAAADFYRLRNDVDSYEPLYRTCYEAFPADPKAGFCHWRVAWGEYLKRRPDAQSLFEEQVKNYTASDDTSAALYFLGRMAEAHGDNSGARCYYEKIRFEYPNYFYAVLARERLQQPAIVAAPASAAVAQSLSAGSFPRHTRIESFEPSAALRVRLERAHLLAEAGLDDLAESELRFSAHTDGQPEVAALHLAELANERDAPDQGIRFIKHYAPAYISMPLDSAPIQFWKLAFPLPYRSALETYSREHNLDPFLVAALIRQESEFKVRAVSSANACGLTQVEPSTGRLLSRRLNIRRFRTDMLFVPDINLKIGIYYLRSMLDRHNGEWAPTLAAYNAGPNRVTAWQTWGEFREPAEFIETIPFGETRNYVQSVLRNADIYRRLYGAATKATSPRPAGTP